MLTKSPMGQNIQITESMILAQAQRELEIMKSRRETARGIVEELSAAYSSIQKFEPPMGLGAFTVLAQGLGALIKVQLDQATANHAEADKAIREIEAKLESYRGQGSPSGLVSAVPHMPGPGGRFNPGRR
jgi:hypothetical protein